MQRAMLAFLAVGLLVGCGSGDGDDKITEQGQCEEELTDYLIDASEAGEVPPAEGVDSEELSAAIEDTLPKFCNEVELRKGVDIDDIGTEAEATLGNELTGFF